MYDKVLSFYKPPGITPNKLIDLIRKKYQEFADVKIGFAGRLDPLAHGVMLMMIGDENKNRDKYLNLSKIYEFQVLFGLDTDTYDVLGFLQSNKINMIPVNLEKQINEFIKSKIGKQVQVYPPYSSKTVQGKPLFQWAREGRLSEIELPTHEIEIFNFDLLKIKEVPFDQIQKKILENINSVDGDFRQSETIKKWTKFFESAEGLTFKIASFKIECSSGTYVRSLGHELGKKIGSGGIALDILRVKVGEYTLSKSNKL